VVDFQLRDLGIDAQQGRWGMHCQVLEGLRHRMNDAAVSENEAVVEQLPVVNDADLQRSRRSVLDGLILRGWCQ
jgi:hypothetical protein